MRVPAVLLVASFFFPAGLYAQAWVPPRGELYFDFNYQWLKADDHLYADDVLGPEPTPIEELYGDLQSTASDEGRVRSHVFLLDADFGVTERLALSGGLAFVQAKWTETGPLSVAEGPIDDGAFHGDFQDARIGVRYKALDSSFILTPSVNFILPLTDYPVLGHAAIGRRLKEAQLGMNFGRLLNLGGVPRLYVQGHYTYAFIEDVDEESLDRSNLALEVGFFHRALTVQLFGAWQKVHGGLEWHNIGEEDSDLDHVLHTHDRFAATRDFQLGGAVTFHVSESADLYVALNNTIWGANTHASRALSFGMSWGLRAFGGIGPAQAHDAGDDPGER